MAQATFSIRMDENLKRQFDALCADFGMTASTAFNVFARAVVRERRIPFEIVSPEVTHASGGQAVMYLREEARKNGVQNLLVEEDNEEIEKSAWKFQRVGVAKEEFKVPDEIDQYNNEILEMFGGCK